MESLSAGPLGVSMREEKIGFMTDGGHRSGILLSSLTRDVVTLVGPRKKGDVSSPLRQNWTNGAG